jgi:hypothetical protein
MLGDDLRFKDGNVVIRLDEKPANTLLLHSAVLKEKSPFFSAAMSDKWYGTKESGDVSLKIFEFDLFYDSDGRAWTLEKRQTALSGLSGEKSNFRFDEQLPGLTEAPNFYERIIPRAEEKISALYGPDMRMGHSLAIEAHRVLFAMLHGVHQKEGHYSSTRFADFHSTLIAYADYYGCLEHVALHIRDRLLLPMYRDYGLRQRVAENPSHYLVVGIYLRDFALFQDAMRHYAGRSQYYQDKVLSLNGTIASFKDDAYFAPETIVLAQRKNREITALVANLTRHLQTILHEDAAELSNDTGRKPIASRAKELFISARKDTRKAAKLRFLAHAVIMDWLNHEIDARTPKVNPFAPQSYKLHCPTSIHLHGGAPFKLLVAGAAQAAKDGDLSFLGKGKPHKALAKTYKLDKHAIKKAFLEVLPKMALPIKEMLRDRHGMPSSAEWQFPDDKFYFTNMDFEVEDRPWEEDWKRRCGKAEEGTEKAGVEWLREVGLWELARMMEEKEEEEEEEEEEE